MAFAFNTTFTVNLDSVNGTTIDNASGEVLQLLGQKIFAEFDRLRRHLLSAERALDEAHSLPWHIQQSLGAEVATTRERLDRFKALLVKAHYKFMDEVAAQQAARRRMPPAIDWLSGDEWDNLGSVFDYDIASLAGTEAETETASQRADALDMDSLNSSFDLIDFDVEDVRVRSGSDSDRSTPTLARRRPTPHASAGSSAAPAEPSQAEPLVFGTSAQSTRRQPSSAHGPAQSCSFPPGYDGPTPTPWDAQAQSSAGLQSSSSTARAAASSSAGSSAAHAVPTHRAPPSSYSASSASLLQHSSPSASAAEALYDDIDFDNRVYGYVAGNAVPVVPERIRLLSLEQLRAVATVRDRRRSRAQDDLGVAFRCLAALKGSPDEAAIVAATLDFSAAEAAVAKADRLSRVLGYEDMHRFDAITPEREAQRSLIEAERRRLLSGGHPLYWSERDAAEARRFQRGRTDYSIWSPAAPPSPPSSARTRSRSRGSRSSTSSASRPRSPPHDEGYQWQPRDSSALAREQYHERVRRLTLQRQGRYFEAPCRTVHVTPFNRRQNKATLQALMRRCGFDVDDDTRVVEYHVTHTKKNGSYHYYGFVTFLHLAAAIRCVEELDRMDVDRHRGMTPLFERRDGETEPQLLLFSFSKNEWLNGSLLRELEDEDEGRGRSSSRAPPARRRHSPARRRHSRAAPSRFGYVPADATDSDHTE